MPFERGNTLGAKSRAFEEAVRRALTQEDGKRLRDAAEQLLDLAASGERWACEMLRDTLDGKPAQAITTEGADGVVRPVQLIVYSPLQLSAPELPASNSGEARLGYQESGSSLAS